MNFLTRLLGKACSHRFSWPRTDTNGRYYQICSRCGIAYEYDWDTMRRTGRLISASVPEPHAETLTASLTVRDRIASRLLLR